MNVIGIFGGTFDPIHNGHLRLAIELYERLNLAQVRLILSACPPHKQPNVTSRQRLQMVQTAVNGIQGLAVDERELQQQGFSYTINTLNSLRKDYSNYSLGLILGMDSFLSLPSWYKWENIIDLAHIIVVNRGQFNLPISSPMHSFLHGHQTDNFKDLTNQIAGKIWFQKIPTLNISATQIRDLIIAKKNPSCLIPAAVLDIINTQQLYGNI